MKRFAVGWTTALVLLIGCAEPNSPVYPPVKYALRQVSLTHTPGWAQDVWVDGSTAFVADDERGVTILDVSSIVSPVITDTIATVLRAKLVRYVPAYQLLFVDENRIAGYNVTSERLVANPWEGSAFDLQAIDLGNQSILAAEINKLEGWFSFIVLKYDSSQSPPWMSTGSYKLWPIPRFAWFRGLDIDSNYVYIAHGEYGLDCYRMTYTGGTFDMTFLGNTDTPGAAYDVAHTADGNYVAVADLQGGLKMIDVTDKAEPRIVGSLIPEGVNGTSLIWVQGDTAYFSDDYNGIYAADISQPSEPRLIAYFETLNPKGLFVTADQTIYLADQDAGLYILRWN
jgi:hypothetical protein